MQHPNPISTIPVLDACVLTQKESKAWHGATTCYHAPKNLKHICQDREKPGLVPEFARSQERDPGLEGGREYEPLLSYIQPSERCKDWEVGLPIPEQGWAAT